MVRVLRRAGFDVVEVESAAMLSEVAQRLDTVELMVGPTVRETAEFRRSVQVDRFVVIGDGTASTPGLGISKPFTSAQLLEAI